MPYLGEPTRPETPVARTNIVHGFEAPNMSAAITPDTCPHDTGAWPGGIEWDTIHYPTRAVCGRCGGSRS